ncbi:hypothetical protein HDV00_006995, partial [Rhizophlyctis rosea]
MTPMAQTAPTPSPGGSGSGGVVGLLGGGAALLNLVTGPLHLKREVSAKVDVGTSPSPVGSGSGGLLSGLLGGSLLNANLGAIHIKRDAADLDVKAGSVDGNVPLGPQSGLAKTLNGLGETLGGLLGGGKKPGKRD